jgi:hypothetical protein
VTIDADSMAVRAIGEEGEDGQLKEIERHDPSGARLAGPISVVRS